MGRSERRSRLVQVALLCASLALCLWCGWLGWQYNGWPWFWASLALHISAWGWLLNLSRALRVGAVAALAGFCSGIVQGADQKLPLIAWEWEHWPLPAAALWLAGASIVTEKLRHWTRFWLEIGCATAIGGIYIYEYVNAIPLNRLLIEMLFGVMLLPSIGGIVGRLRRSTLLDRSGRASMRSPASAIEEAKALLRNR